MRSPLPRLQVRFERVVVSEMGLVDGIVVVSVVELLVAGRTQDRDWLVADRGVDKQLEVEDSDVRWAMCCVPVPCCSQLCNGRRTGKRIWDLAPAVRRGGE
jgi:hypothetical protein